MANTLAAVEAGVMHVQGTINGHGERTGNANLITVVANLQLKYGWQVIPPESLREATRISHAIAGVTNVPPYSRQPYVGSSAFAHKAGLHASAIKVDANLYQHIDPTLVGNDMRMLISDMAGRANIQIKGSELGYDLSDRTLAARITDVVKAREMEGYSYESADASFELLLRSSSACRRTSSRSPAGGCSPATRRSPKVIPRRPSRFVSRVRSNGWWGRATAR